MKSIIGLGNPGPDYVFNRHNAGFLFLDHLCSKMSCSPWEEKSAYFHSSVNISGIELLLFKPTTYMNLSGIAVDRITKDFGVSPGEILVVYDDVSIPLGRIRIRRRGSDGGHNGLRSIINALQTEDFPRLRVGIGPKPEGVRLADYVLSDFSEEELRVLYRVFDVALEAVGVIIEHGIDRAMSLYNSTEVIA